jgi:hypothetical protein
MIFSTSSIFELHMVVATIVMFNILKLIMEIVHKYPIEEREESYTTHLLNYLFIKFMSNIK